MYQPLPPRPKKTNIVRVRTGCQTCRRRKLKCDEGKPECRACLRRGIYCEGYAQRIAFRNDTNSVVHRVINSEKQKWELIRAEQQRESTPKGSVKRRKRSLETCEDEKKEVSYLIERSTHSPSAGLLVADASRYSNEPVAQDSTLTYPNETSNAASQLLSLSESLKTPNSSFESVDSASPDEVSSYNGDGASERQGTNSPNTPSSIANTSQYSYMDSISSCGPSGTEVTLYHGSPYDDTSSGTLDTPTERDGWNSSPKINAGELTTNEDSYIAYWRTSLLPQLPSVFQRCESTWLQFRVFRNATLLIASADIAHANIGRRGSSQRQASVMSQHRLNSLDYYSEALRNLSVAGSCTNDLIEECVKLAVLLLFAFFEMESGTFAGSVVHVKQMDKLISDNIHLYSTSEDGRDLVCAWNALRALLSCDCTPWSSTGFPCRTVSDATHLCVQNIMQHSATTYEHLMPLLKESCQLNGVVFLGRTFGFDASVSTYRAWTKRLDGFGYRSPGLQLSEKYSPLEVLDSLTELSHKLDMWHDSLDIVALPIEGYTSTDIEKYDNAPGLHVKPLRFHDHDSAMNYARYACAQLLCSKSNLDRCMSLLPLQRDDVSPWALLILRVVAGLDPNSCVERNTFKTGIIWILSRIALVCASNEVVAWIELWLHKAWQSGMTKEASIPLSTILKYVRKIRILQDDGYRIRFMFCSITGRSERFSLYSEGSSFQALVYGIDTKKGATLGSKVIEV